MYFLLKSDAEVLLPTQPPFYWLILEFLHQTRGNTWKKIQYKALTISAWIWESHRATTISQSLVVSWDTAEASGNDSFLHMSFHISRTLFSILVDGNNTVVGMVYTYPLLSKSSSSFTKNLDIVPRTIIIIISIIVILVASSQTCQACWPSIAFKSELVFSFSLNPSEFFGRSQESFGQRGLYPSPNLLSSE